jgi:hypothetical protein
MQGLMFFFHRRDSAELVLCSYYSFMQSSGEPLSACSYCAAKHAIAQRPAVEVKGENCLASAKAIVDQILLAR